jgi:hypothetical protein
MPREGESKAAPSYTNLQRTILRRDQRKGTDWTPSSGASGAIPAAGQRVSKEQRKTGRK